MFTHLQRKKLSQFETHSFKTEARASVTTVKHAHAQKPLIDSKQSIPDPSTRDVLNN